MDQEIKRPRARPGALFILVFILSVMVPIVMVPPLFVRLMLVMPVFGIAIFMVCANEFLLIMLATEMIVIAAMFIIMQVRLRLVNDYLVTVIDVEIAVAGRHVAREYPPAFALIDKLMVGNIIITLHVGNIVIFDMVIPGGAPGRLNANVDGKMDLCLDWVGEGDAEEDGACQDELFHTF